MMLKTRTTTALTALAIAAFALTGCTANTPEESATAPASDSVTITHTWVKTADDGMSAAFGELANIGSQDVTVISVTSESSTELELHETVENESGEMVMREKSGGFTIPAGKSLLLEPGGNHIMLMNLTAPIMAGNEITFTLTFSDGSTATFTAPAKDYSGANENYEGDDMDMSGH